MEPPQGVEPWTYASRVWLSTRRLASRGTENPLSDRGSGRGLIGKHRLASSAWLPVWLPLSGPKCAPHPLGRVLGKPYRMRTRSGRSGPAGSSPTTTSPPSPGATEPIARRGTANRQRAERAAGDLGRSPVVAALLSVGGDPKPWPPRGRPRPPPSRRPAGSGQPGCRYRRSSARRPAVPGFRARPNVRASAGQPRHPATGSRQQVPCLRGHWRACEELARLRSRAPVRRPCEDHGSPAR